MPSRYAMTEKKIATFDKQGRGKGRGSSYKSWLTIQDLSSKGRVARAWSQTARREHHYFSDLEYALGLECDWNPAVIDLREQFPLPRSATLAIAEDIGVKHPRDRDCHIVMTTDLVVDLKVAGVTTMLAISVKYKNDLEGKGAPRVFEKLEIERRYWRQQGVAWTLMTESEILKDRSETYRRLRQYHDFAGLKPPPSGTWLERAALVDDALRAVRRGTLAAFCEKLDIQNGWESGDALAMIWHLVANRRADFDLAKGLDVRGPLSQLSVFPVKIAVAA